MIEEGKRYIRTAPNGDESIAVVGNQEQVKYHTELAEKGFKYKEVVPAPVIGGVCVSCEG